MDLSATVTETGSPIVDGEANDADAESGTGIEDSNDEPQRNGSIITETLEPYKEGETSIDLTQNTLSGTPVTEISAGIAAVNTDLELKQPTSEPDSDVLLLKASEESWVSVIDANAKRLMYGILTSGTPRKLQGLAPFSVVLGAAEGVEATFNGEVLVFSRLIRKSKTARFVIEADGSIHR